ncbi:MAG: polysaccharide deacetylase family protein, partial [Chitinivibrionales bacterium]|nr:polysaccharide deacetylase family protein [Chitinivibrionales bacterium]MBD3358319.1 polysaccharide deacetylase family protein [Chitinivibrionales bacterium]
HSHVMVWAGITLGLCGILFGLAQMRENRRLRRDISKLQDNRARLVSLVKAKNARIAKLKSAQAALDSARARNSRKKRVAQHRRTQPRRTYEGIPYTFNHGARHLKLVSLTFDGGAHANAADDILDTLKSRNVKATMFLTGNFVRRYPSLIRRIVREGHDIGNHTDRHPRLTSWARDRTQTTLPSVNQAMLAEELMRANAAFRKVTGRDFDPIWRAPYGERNREICLWARQAGYLHVGWGQGRTWAENLDTNDWVPDEHTPGYHSPREVYEKIMRRAVKKPYGINGGIILLHLGTVRKEPEKQVHLIVGRLIDSLQKRGYRVVPVTEMVKKSGVDVVNFRRRSGIGRAKS